MKYTLNHRVLDIEVRSISFGLVSYTVEPEGGFWTRRLCGAVTHMGGCVRELLLDLGIHTSEDALSAAAKLLFEARFVGKEDHVRTWVERLGALEAAPAAAPDANCFTMPDGECVSEKPCMHSPPPPSTNGWPQPTAEQLAQNRAAVAALPCLVCGTPGCTHGPAVPAVLFPPGWRSADPQCPGCGQRECAKRYLGCRVTGTEACLVASTLTPQSRLNAVAGFQLRPPPRQVLVLVDDQSEPP